MMNCFSRVLIIASVLLCASAFARDINVTSPDKKIRFTLSADEQGLTYRVYYKGNAVINQSRLNISFKEGGAFSRQLKLGKAVLDQFV
jgi:hypothetical protein